jgi:uncharacterized protein (TIGR03437 family)
MSRTSSLLLGAALAVTAVAQPSIDTVLNGASFNATLSPGCWATVFGKNLAGGTASAQTVPLPTSLGGTSIKVGDIDAPLLYVSPTQINFLIPASVAIPTNTVVPVVLSTSPAASATYSIRLARNSPAIFTRNGAGTGRALLFDASFSAVDIVNPQDTVILYATGLGPTAASGTTADVAVYIGERPAQVKYAGLAPGFPGIYQLNVVAPTLATDRIYIVSGGWTSNIADVGIKAGANTANVSGSIRGLYPSTDPYFTLPRCASDVPSGQPCNNGQDSSFMLNAASYNVAFDVVPSAAPFDVAAVGPGISALLMLNPATNSIGFTVATISRPAAVGNFSGTSLTIWDYATCTPATGECQRFPANVVPVNRLDPRWMQAAQALPAPNGPIPAFGAPDPNSSTTGLAVWKGTRLALDTTTVPALTTVGGFVQVPYGPFERSLSTFKLYVDGRLIASQDVPYVVPHR